jgi:hypothetical protein
MFSGTICAVLAVGMLVLAFVLPEEARVGLIGGALGVGIAAAVLLYLNWPDRKETPAGKVKAKAFVVDAKLTGTEATGNRVVEMTLDVHPKDGMPFQVTRKFLGRMASIEQGQRIDVFYDPADPEKVTLA